MSLGGYSNDERQKAYAEAIKYAKRSGVIIVAAAGNENRNAKNHVPAGCEGVIAVAAIDDQLEKATFSNFISDLKMGIAAPGVGILSTVPGNKYEAWSSNGTKCN